MAESKDEDDYKSLKHYKAIEVSVRLFVHMHVSVSALRYAPLSLYICSSTSCSLQYFTFLQNKAVTLFEAAARGDLEQVQQLSVADFQDKVGQMAVKISR